MVAGLGVGRSRVGAAVQRQASSDRQDDRATAGIGVAVVVPGTAAGAAEGRVEDGVIDVQVVCRDGDAPAVIALGFDVGTAAAAVVRVERCSRFHRHVAGDRNLAGGICRKGVRKELEHADRGLGREPDVTREGEGLGGHKHPRARQDVLLAGGERDRPAEVEEAAKRRGARRERRNALEAARQRQRRVRRNGEDAGVTDVDVVERPGLARLHARAAVLAGVADDVAPSDGVVAHEQRAVRVGGVLEEDRAGAGGVAAERTVGEQVRHRDRHAAGRRHERHAPARTGITGVGCVGRPGRARGDVDRAGAGNGTGGDEHRAARAVALFGIRARKPLRTGVRGDRAVDDGRAGDGQFHGSAAGGRVLVAALAAGTDVLGRVDVAVHGGIGAAGGRRVDANLRACGTAADVVAAADQIDPGAGAEREVPAHGDVEAVLRRRAAGDVRVGMVRPRAAVHDAVARDREDRKRAVRVGGPELHGAGVVRGLRPGGDGGGGVPCAVRGREVSVEADVLRRRRHMARRPVRGGGGQVFAGRGGVAHPVVLPLRRREVRDCHGHGRGDAVVAGGEGDRHRRVGGRRDVDERRHRDGRRGFAGGDDDGARVVHVVHAGGARAVREGVAHDQRKRVGIRAAHRQRRGHDAKLAGVGNLRQREGPPVEDAEGDRRRLAALVLGRENRLVGRVVRRRGERAGRGRARREGAGAERDGRLGRGGVSVRESVRHVRVALRKRGGGGVDAGGKREGSLREDRHGRRDRNHVRQLRADEDLVEGDHRVLGSVFAVDDKIVEGRGGVRDERRLGDAEHADGGRPVGRGVVIVVDRDGEGPHLVGAVRPRADGDFGDHDVGRVLVHVADFVLRPEDVQDGLQRSAGHVPEAEPEAGRAERVAQTADFGVCVGEPQPVDRRGLEVGPRAGAPHEGAEVELFAVGEGRRGGHRPVDGPVHGAGDRVFESDGRIDRREVLPAARGIRESVPGAVDVDDAGVVPDRPGGRDETGLRGPVGGRRLVFERAGRIAGGQVEPVVDEDDRSGGQGRERAKEKKRKDAFHGRVVSWSGGLDGSNPAGESGERVAVGEFRGRRRLYQSCARETIGFVFWVDREHAAPPLGGAREPRYRAVPQRGRKGGGTAGVPGRAKRLWKAAEESGKRTSFLPSGTSWWSPSGAPTSK